MGSSAIFGFNPTPGNNAPPPISPNVNPTGGSTGTGGNKGGFPGFPAITSPQANAPIFGSTNIGGLSSGFGTGSPGNWQRELDRAFGKGTGDLLFQLFSQGLFNPQTAAAFMNAMQPSYNQGIASVEQAFGAEGARFGSPAALGIGNFASQFALNEQQVLASMFTTSQSNELQLLSSILPTLHTEQANQSGGILSDILGSLEIAGGVAAAPFTGGASLGLVGSGVSTLTGGGGSPASTPNVQKAFAPLFTGTKDPSSTGPVGYTYPQDLTANLGGYIGQTTGAEALGPESSSGPYMNETLGLPPELYNMIFGGK